MLVTGERIVNKKHPVSRIIKNFGTALNETDLAHLIQQAETYKNNLIACAPKAKLLRVVSDDDLKSCRTLNVGFSDVYGRFFNKVFSSLPLKPNFIRQLHDLIVMRIASPASKRKTVELALEYGMKLNVDGIYKLMDRLTEPMINQIKKSYIITPPIYLLKENKPLIFYFMI